MYKVSFFVLTIFTFIIDKSSSTWLWCYRCTSATPGCGEEFNWRGIGYFGELCPESDDLCVKVVERRGGQTHIIRDCLSSLRSFRTDIPADHYEGCRKSSTDVKLAHYVNHTIKEHDVKRDYFSDVTWCFCFLDHRCNGAESQLQKYKYLPVFLSLTLWILRKII